jgi:hypothetical protein
MEKKSVISFLITMILIVLFSIWMIFPYQVNYFESPKETNFSVIGNSMVDSQFYSNLRFPSKEISYRIDSDCSLQKQNDMEEAFSIMENATILNFYPVEKGEEISVYCSDEVKQEGNLFIAGEGGPTNITKLLDYNVIFNGKVLLIKDSSCPTPNVAIHELIHVLGFDHSENKNNIMYPISRCNQDIGDDTIQLINDLYSVPSLPDLVLLNSVAKVHGRYLDLNVTVKNEGFIRSEAFKVNVYADDNNVREIEVAPIEVGYGRNIMLTNIGINLLSVDKFKLMIESNFSEINSDNNEIVLNLKN